MRDTVAVSLAVAWTLGRSIVAGVSTNVIFVSWEQAIRPSRTLVFVRG